MSKKQERRNKRREKIEAHNKEVEETILQLERQLQEKEQQKQALQTKANDMESEMSRLKQSKLWMLLRRVRRFVKTMLAYSTGRKNWQQMFRKNKQKQARNQVKRLKYQLYEQGFKTQALKEIEEVIEKTDNRYLRQQASLELALWHANQYKASHANIALTYLKRATKGVRNVAFLRRAAILAAECHDILDQCEQGKNVIETALAREEHADLYLAMANLEESNEKRMNWMNKALEQHDIAPISIKDNDYHYDQLITTAIPKRAGNMPKITVIIPVYNAEDGVKTALDSILNQTWENIEVLVVDDCSTDQTVDVIQPYVAQDKRVKLLTTEKNGGPYIARNIALQVATGDYVTINDADDWSHLGKLEVQAKHLLENDHVIANTSQQARLTEDLIFFRRGKPGEYIFANMSSLMFRRKPVMEKLGYWDCVRFGADGEFKHRLKRVFGKEAVVDLQTGPYSFQRQSSGSLTGSSKFGYHGYFMGVRKEYAESYRNYHEQATSLYYPFPIEKRLFPVPEPMWPEREEKEAGKRHFDVLIASEFRLLGGTNMSNVEEIKAQTRLGLKTGLVQMNRYDLQSVKDINPKVRQLVDGEQVQMVVYGEEVTCDVLIIRHPPVLQHWQKYLPTIEAKSVRVIINQPPKREYSTTGKTLYDLKTCAKHLKTYVGKTGKWYPIGPVIRKALEQHHRKELQSIDLSAEDWVNIIDVAEWYRGEHEVNKPIRIGRHSRDQFVKWPANKEVLEKIYPSTSDYEIHVLGGATAPKKVLGQLPSNWQVYLFGEREPKDFLRNIDVFVYYTHPDWVEAFGRVIFEAMAAGVPVIISPSYQPLFKEAAIYAEPNDVQTKINELVDNKNLYDEQVKKALQYVEEQFGYTKHKQRLADCLVNVE